MPFLGMSDGKTTTPPKYEPGPPSPPICKKTIGEDFCYLVYGPILRFPYLLWGTASTPIPELRGHDLSGLQIMALNPDDNLAYLAYNDVFAMRLYWGKEDEREYLKYEFISKIPDPIE